MNSPTFRVTLESQTFAPILWSEVNHPRVALADANDLFDACWNLRITAEVVIREGEEVVARFRTRGSPAR